MGKLYYGDNLHILKTYIMDESIDLIYLDPPFNSKADYNVLFKESSGEMSASQIRAFTDTWKWNEESVLTFLKLIEDPSIASTVKNAIESIIKLLGHNDMSAYLIMMTARLVELRRVLKSTGSIYLHCDPTASHYLKLVMDSIFGPTNFRNEIIWKRTSGHSDSGTCGRAHDTLLLYSKSDEFIWNKQYQEHDPEYLDSHYRYTTPDGRRYRVDNLTATGLSGGGYDYEWKGVRRVWRCPIETMKKLDADGRIYYTRNGVASYVRYLDEMKGTPLQDVWTDIPPINSQAAERLGYPTQKPLGLLERIVNSSSNEGHLVLDPFCGCGTTIHAAQKLNRQWIGIDITHLAINLIKRRLKDAFGISPEVIGEPEDFQGAVQLASQDRFQFQFWALSLIGATPLYDEKKKGADRGIDGVLYNPVKMLKKLYKGYVQVKSGHVKSGDIRDFRGTIERDKVDYGVFLTLEDPSEPMKSEALEAGFFTTEWKHAIPRIQVMTIKELMTGKEPIYPFPADNYMKAEKEKKVARKRSPSKRLESFEQQKE